jgi:hypothetical protein
VRWWLATASFTAAWIFGLDRRHSAKTGTEQGVSVTNGAPKPYNKVYHTAPTVLAWWGAWRGPLEQRRTSGRRNGEIQLGILARNIWAG